MFEGVLKLFHLFERPYKVGIVSYYYPYKKPSTSGVGIHVYNLVTHLAKLGCEVHVFTNGEKDATIKNPVDNGEIIIHSIKSDFSFEHDDPVIKKRTRYALFENKVLNKFLYEHSKRAFKVVHTHGWLTSSAFMLKYLDDIPWIHTVHALERNRLNSMTEEEKKLFRITSWIEDTIADSDKLIAVSKSVHKEIIKAFGNADKKINIIPNGVDLRLFRPAKKTNNTILCISRFSKEKGADLLPEIIERVLEANKQCSFKIVIQETTLPALKPVQEKFLSLKEKYPERFSWISQPISAMEIAKLHQGASIYVQPSYYEAFGLCILESMACGNAVVATNVGGIPEVVGDTAILVKPNAKEISNALIKLLKNKELIKKLSKSAFERSKSFDWSIIAKNTLGLYEGLSKKRKEKHSEL